MLPTYSNSELICLFYFILSFVQIFTCSQNLNVVRLLASLWYLFFIQPFSQLSLFSFPIVGLNFALSFMNSLESAHKRPSFSAPFVFPFLVGLPHFTIPFLHFTTPSLIFTTSAFSSLRRTGT